MPYKRKTEPSLEYRDIMRRRKRKFDELRRNHQRFIELLLVPEIGKHHQELVKVLWDFYQFGVDEGMALGYGIFRKVTNEMRGRIVR